MTWGEAASMKGGNAAVMGKLRAEGENKKIAPKATVK
jgi:hypothetical protein